MKALKFLELLTVSEKKQLEKELKIQDNAELLQLWKIIQHHLRKGTPLPETKELINSIYGAAYSAKLDNRLRNLFFQLNEGAKKILVHKQLSTHSPKTRKYQQMILLEALQQRQADELYEKLLQEEMDNSLLQHDYLHYANLGNMQVLNEMLAGKDEKKKYYQASAMLEQQAPYYDAAIKSLIAQRNVVIGLYNFTVRGAETHTLSTFLPVEAYHSSFPENEYVQYLEKRQKVFDPNFPNKTDLLKENVAFLEKNDNEVFEQDLFVAYSNLFIFLIFEKKYAEVEAILPQLIQQAVNNKKSVTSGRIHLMRLNILSFCLKRFKLKECATIIQTMENNKTPSSYLVRTNLMIVWYYFFTNNTPKIEAIVTELQQTELDKSGKLYLKIIELIQYFLMQELEMVETWISNISQYTRYNKVDNIALQEFVKLFRKVMYWKSKHYFDNEELPAKLQQNIAQKYQAYAINDFYSLPLAWLYFYVMEGTKS